MPIPDAPTAPTVDAIPVSTPSSEAAPRPGVVVIYENGKPVCRPYPFNDDLLCIGRSHVCDVVVSDPFASARHVLVGIEDGRITVEDLDSKHGTRADRVPVTGRAGFPCVNVVALGQSLVLVSEDVGPFLRWPLEVRDGYVIGPSLAETLELIRVTAGFARPLLILGETGTGKQGAARLYHEAARQRRGPFVEINCARLEKERAEAELFGTKRGAFTGAVDGQGALSRADRGTLFLDELGELSLPVQGKLLKVLEDGLVTPLGSQQAHKVDVRVVCATNADLESMIGRGAFRQDLYQRLSRVTVAVAPLRVRREEIPWHIERVEQETWTRGGGTPLPHTFELVRECVLRGWHGKNLRALDGAIDTAIVTAVAKRATEVDAIHLPPVPAEPEPLPEDVERALLEDAIRRHGGNVSMAAKELGIGRTTVYRRRKR